MIIFTIKEHQTSLSEIIQLKINPQDDYETQIKVLEPNETALMAESISCH